MAAQDSGSEREFFAALFAFLRAQDYVWVAPEPSRLQLLRKRPAEFPPLVRYLGLGLGTPEEAGLPAALHAGARLLKPSVSRLEDQLIAHAHWPSLFDDVYFGPEGAHVYRNLRARAGSFRGRNALDLGSGSGVLSFALSGTARSVLGLELSARAVRWSSASAAAQGIDNARFLQAPIGSPAAAAAIREGDWTLAVANPPLAIPGAKADRPQRDGGRLGLELPLAFLDFAASALKPGGEFFWLVADPTVAGRSMLAPELAKRGSQWEELARERLHSDFNRELHRKDGYAKLGVERIELLWLHLKARDR